MAKVERSSKRKVDIENVELLCHAGESVVGSDVGQLKIFWQRGHAKIIEALSTAYLARVSLRVGPNGK